MDDEEPEDYDVVRLWVIARVAKEFGALPSVVARDLDEDPEQLSLLAVQVLGYGSAKAEYDAAQGDAQKLKHWKNSDLMDTVRDNTFKAMKARLDHRRQHPKGGVADCRLCRSYAPAPASKR